MRRIRVIASLSLPSTSIEHLDFLVQDGAPRSRRGLDEQTVRAYPR